MSDPEPSWVDPDWPVYEVLRRYGCSMSGGQVGGEMMTTVGMPDGDSLNAMTAELEAVGLRKLIVDISTGRHVVVGEFDPLVVTTTVAECMRSSSFRPDVWPPPPPGGFPLLCCWAYPYGSDEGTGRDLFCSGRGARTMRVFLAPDLAEDPGAPGCAELFAHLGSPEVQALVLENDGLALAGSEQLRFLPDAGDPLNGTVEWGSHRSAVRSSDSVRFWRTRGPTHFRELTDDRAGQLAERDTLAAHVAAAAGADIIVTRSPVLLSRPDGIADRTPHLRPSDALSIVSLHLRQRDLYAIVRPDQPGISVRADRAHYFRAAARGVLPRLHDWRTALEASTDDIGGHLQVLGESLEHRVARSLGQRDELLAHLLVRQDANTAFRAMEHLDAVLTNLYAAFDITVRAADALRTRGESPERAGASWIRRRGQQLRAEFPEVGELFDEDAVRLLELMSDLRNTLHGEMLVPQQESTSRRTGITLAEVRPRNLVDFESKLSALGELDEWGFERRDSTACIDPRRFLAQAIPRCLALLDGVLDWMLREWASDVAQSPDYEFGTWFPLAVCQELALGPQWAPRRTTPTTSPPEQPAAMFTAVLGVIDLEGSRSVSKARTVVAGNFGSPPQPFRDFNNGDWVRVTDPLLEQEEWVRVSCIHVRQKASDEAHFTVTFSRDGQPPSTTT